MCVNDRFPSKYMYTICLDVIFRITNLDYVVSKFEHRITNIFLFIIVFIHTSHE